jgi:hypothetical protein
MFRYAKFSALALLLSGCAAAQPSSRGPVVSEVTRESQICFSQSGALREGEAVRFSRRVVGTLNAKSTVPTMHIEPGASGRVVRVVDDRCSIVRLALGEDVQAGDEIISATTTAQR